MSEIPLHLRQAAHNAEMDDLSVAGDGFVDDAKAELAKLFSMAAGSVSEEWCKAAEYMILAHGRRGLSIVRRQLSLKPRMTGGVLKQSKEAIKALSDRDDKDISLMGMGGSGKE